MKTALVMVELQNDHFPQGKVPVEKSIDACLKAKTVLNAHRHTKQPIIHIQHISTNPKASHFLPCTKGAEIHPSVYPIRGEPVIKKHYPNSFKDTLLLHYLNKHRITHLVICGMTTQLAIDATVRAACDLGFTCTVLYDACAARHTEFNYTLVTTQHVHYAFLATLQQSYASVLSVNDYLKRINTQPEVAHS